MRKALAWLPLFAALVLVVQLLTVPDAAAQGFPQGSYLQSCAQIHWSGATLVAECQRRDGRFTGTGLPNAMSCVGDIFNNDGQLSCRYAGGPGYGAPAPGYAPPPYPGYGEGRERCGELWHRQRELRERLEATPWGPERERLEYRLHEIHEERERLACG